MARELVILCILYETHTRSLHVWTNHNNYSDCVSLVKDRSERICIYDYSWNIIDNLCRSDYLVLEFKEMKVLAATTLFNRPATTEIFFAGMRRLNLPVLAAISAHGDRQLCISHNIPYVMAPNQPLGNKWNVLLTHALSMDWTHLLISGDDNLYHSNLPKYWNPELDYQGLRNIHFIEPSTNRAQLLTYDEDPPIAIGTGRLLSRKAVTSLIRNDMVHLNRPEQTRELDGIQDMMLLEQGFMPTIIDPYPMCIDIKHKRNMWSFDNFAPRSEPCDYDDTISWLSDEERKLLSNLVM